MLTRRRVPRRGFTLAELLVVLALGCIVLGVASAVGLRLQREIAAESTAVAVEEQLAGAAEVLPIDLRGLSPVAGDIAAGSDSALEVRATIGNAIACAGTAGTITLAFHRGAGGRAVVPRAAVGDTLWVLQDADADESWRPAPLTALRRAVGDCAALDRSADLVIDRSHPWAADIRDTGTVQAGSVVRLTRPQRFSFYRASDGQWYLGLRSWNSDVRAFNGVQPIGGPYRSPALPHGVRLSYFDSAGAIIPTPFVGSRRIARVEALLSADDAGHAAASAIESLTVVTALRNRDD
jgi:prepilin-type N-terminal cleavage/methylation domain-containing protein